MTNQAREMTGDRVSSVKIDESQSYITIRDQVLRWLAGREYTVRQLRVRLLRDGYSVVDVDAVLDYLVSRDYLSDQRAAEELILRRIRGGYGPFKIQAELQHIGISETMAVDLMSETVVDWHLVIHELLEKRTTSTQVLECRREKARQVRYLAHRGFSIDQIMEALYLWN